MQKHFSIRDKLRSITETWNIGLQVSLLLLGLIRGHERIEQFTKLGRTYRIRSTLAPYQVIIEPLDQ